MLPHGDSETCFYIFFQKVFGAYCKSSKEKTRIFYFFDSEFSPLDFPASPPLFRHQQLNAINHTLPSFSKELFFSLLFSQLFPPPFIWGKDLRKRRKGQKKRKEAQKRRRKGDEGKMQCCYLGAGNHPYTVPKKYIFYIMFILFYNF